MRHSTYSFADTNLVLSHPSLGQITLTGEGCGNIRVSRAQDASQNDVANDGSVMTSKISVKYGTLSFDAQQTSPASQTLQKWYDYLENAPSREWAQMTGRLENTETGEAVKAMNGGSFQKMPDINMTDKGQNRSWTILFQEIA